MENKYYLIVITGSGRYSVVVEADGFTHYESAYRFIKKDGNGLYDSAIAYYPISHTIIEKIEPKQD